MSWDSETRAAFVDILVSPGVDDLNQSPRFNEMKATHDLGHLFYRIASRVQRVYRSLNRGMRVGTSSREGVMTCIDQQIGYLRVGDIDAMRDCRQLGSRGWSNTWNPAQVEYFQRVNALMDRGMKDYFLSFTGRSPTTINTLHAGLFLNRFCWDLYTADKNSKNLLAKAIAQIFGDEGLHGYYYHDREDDNRLLDQELERECARCLVLVQIVQKTTFDGPVAKNYCYLELEAFKKGLAAQVLGMEHALKFILGDCSYDDVKKRRIPPPYQKWHDLVTAKKVMTIPPDTGQEFGEATAKARDLIVRLANQVEEARNRLITSVPE